jgi:hypothetical protein
MTYIVAVPAAVLLSQLDQRAPRNSVAGPVVRYHDDGRTTLLTGCGPVTAGS